MKRFLMKLGFVCSTLLLLISCDGGGATSTATNTPVAMTAINGRVVLGPLNGGLVDVYNFNMDGSRGRHVAGSFLTTNGQWSGAVPASSTGPFEIVVTGGNYVDEATGKSVKLQSGQEITSIASVPATGGISVAVTPLTHAMKQQVLDMALKGSNTTITKVVAQVETYAQTTFGFNPSTLLPPDPMNVPATASVTEKEYAAIIGGLSSMGDVYSAAKNAALANLPANTSPFEIAIAFSMDLADGKLDGKNLGVLIQVGGLNLPALDVTGIKTMVTNTNAFAQKTPSLSTVVMTGTVQWQVSSIPATNQTATNQTATNQTATNQTATNQTATNQTATNQTATNQTATNQTATNQTATNSTVGTIQAARNALAANNLPLAKAEFAAVSAATPQNLEAAIGFCAATFAELSGDAALRTLIGKFTIDAGSNLPMQATIAADLANGVATQSNINWVKTGTQLTQTAVNASLLQDPAFDQVAATLTTCISSLESVKASGFTLQTIAQGGQSVVWDVADLNAYLSIFYGARGGLQWSRAYNWSTDVDNDGIQDTQTLSYNDPYTNSRYQYSTASIDPVAVLNDATFFTLAGGGSAQLAQSITDFHAAATLQSAYLSDMYANLARSWDVTHMFQYIPAPSMIPLKEQIGIDMKDMNNMVQAFSGNGYLVQNTKAAYGSMTSGSIFADKLSLMNRNALPVFSYNVQPDFLLSKKYNSPVLAEQVQGFSSLTIDAVIIADKSYDSTLAGVLGTGLTLNLMDDMQRPISSVLLHDANGSTNTMAKFSSFATDGTNAWLVETLSANVNIVRSIDLVTGLVGNSVTIPVAVGSYLIPHINPVVINGQMRTYLFRFDQATGNGFHDIVDINPVTGVITKVMTLLNFGVANRFGVQSFTSNGVDYFLSVSDWINGTTSLYQTPTSTLSMSTRFYMGDNFLIGADMAYIYSHHWLLAGVLMRTDTSGNMTSLQWNDFATARNVERVRAIVGNKAYQLRSTGTATVLNVYTLPTVGFN